MPLATVPLLFDPGTQWSYSIAVDVQVLLVEKLSGRPFAAFVREHVLEPLDIRDTGSREPDEKLPRLAALYRKTEAKLARNPDESTRRLNFHDNRLTGAGSGWPRRSTTICGSPACCWAIYGAGYLGLKGD